MKQLSKQVPGTQPQLYSAVPGRLGVLCQCQGCRSPGSKSVNHQVAGSWVDLRVLGPLGKAVPLYLTRNPGQPAGEAYITRPRPDTLCHLTRSRERVEVLVRLLMSQAADGDS